MQKIRSLIVFSVVLNFAAPVVAHAATIADNSFETPYLGPAGFAADPAGSDWSFSGGAGIAGQGSPFFSTTPPDGTQAGFLQSYQSQGSFSQTITDLTIGDTYDLTFWDAVRTGYPATEFTVSLGGTQIGDYIPGSYSFVSQTTDYIVATSTSETLVFQSITSLDGNDYDSVIDLVNINDLTPSTPEPGTFWLLLPAAGYFAFRARKLS
jgi:hypothetical protein